MCREMSVIIREHISETLIAKQGHLLPVMLVLPSYNSANGAPMPPLEPFPGMAVIFPLLCQEIRSSNSIFHFIPGFFKAPTHAPEGSPGGSCQSPSRGHLPGNLTVTSIHALWSGAVRASVATSGIFLRIPWAASTRFAILVLEVPFPLRHPGVLVWKYILAESVVVVKLAGKTSSEAFGRQPILPGASHCLYSTRMGDGSAGAARRLCSPALRPQWH